MEADFWRRKWRDRELGWHQSEPHPMLARGLANLGLKPPARVFLPLCGKTLDIGWLRSEGVCVAGAELVESAVEELFAELGETPRISAAGTTKRYAADGIEIFVGDLFDLDAATLGPVDAVYDRAALVALSPQMRATYERHLRALTRSAPQILVTFDYDQARMEGPPFAVPEEQVRALYGGAYEIERLETREVEGGLKGRCPASETAWRLMGLR